MKNSSISITATLVDAGLLKNLVEELAGRRADIGYSHEKMQPGWQAVEISSIEAYVSGDANFSEKADKINMPFITCFLFTCLKAKGSKYNMSWASSLS